MAMEADELEMDFWIWIQIEGVLDCYQDGGKPAKEDLNSKRSRRGVAGKVEDKLSAKSNKSKQSQMKRKELKRNNK